MLLLAIFAFVSGVITILSPCILPVLPIILSGTFGGRMKPYGVVLGFIGSFSVATLALATLVRVFQFPPDVLRWAAILMIGALGISMLVPAIHRKIEELTGRLSANAPSSNRGGFLGGLLIGTSLGVIWTPCVGPILAAVITLAATSSVSLGAVVVTLSFALGTAIPMLAIMLGGARLLNQRRWLQQHAENIQRLFGVLLVLVSLAMVTGLDRAFQTWILEIAPGYAELITSLESNEMVRQRVKESLR